MSVGFSQRQTLFILYGGCLLFGALGLVISAASPALGWQVAAVGLALIAALYALMIYVREKVQKAK
jgi:hypothetical protein